ncbi:unnamed protein product [Amoebophrya sp. A120]|nr:unnamed protein product [Amoebophrya sp. A120]|eukprot:GSA120T00006254001.1
MPMSPARPKSQTGTTGSGSAQRWSSAAVLLRALAYGSVFGGPPTTDAKPTRDGRSWRPASVRAPKRSWQFHAGTKTPYFNEALYNPYGRKFTHPPEKSSYFHAVDANATKKTYALRDSRFNWRLQAADVLFRHGTRTPDGKKLTKWRKLKRHVAERHRRTDRWLQTDLAAFEKQDAALVERGWEELARQGLKWRFLLSSFANNSTRLQYESSSKSRCTQSGNAFLAGLHDALGENPFGKTHEDRVLALHDQRLRYFDASTVGFKTRLGRRGSKMVIVPPGGWNATAAAPEFRVHTAAHLKDYLRWKNDTETGPGKNKQYLREFKKHFDEHILPNVTLFAGEQSESSSNNLHTKWNLTTADAYALWNLAIMERALLNKSAMGDEVFGEETDFLQMERLMDYAHFYKSGFGNPNLAAEPFAANFFQEWTYFLSLGPNNEKKFRFAFAHAETILPVLMWLQVYAWKAPEIPLDGGKENKAARTPPTAGGVDGSSSSRIPASFFQGSFLKPLELQVRDVGLNDIKEIHDDAKREEEKRRNDPEEALLTNFDCTRDYSVVEEMGAITATRVLAPFGGSLGLLVWLRDQYDGEQDHTVDPHAAATVHQKHSTTLGASEKSPDRPPGFGPQDECVQLTLNENVIFQWTSRQKARRFLAERLRDLNGGEDEELTWHEEDPPTTACDDKSDCELRVEESTKAGVSATVAAAPPKDEL